MSNKMLVTMRFDQRLMMNQQLQQAIMLMQYNTLDLKQLVQQYVEKNPLLDADDSDVVRENDEDKEQYSTMSHYSALQHKAHHYHGEDENAIENYAIPNSLRTHLLNQTLLCKFNPDEQSMAEMIIDAIDDNGFLTMSLEEIQKISAVYMSIDHMRAILTLIQNFDPIGVGAIDIRECLLIQLLSMPNKDKTWEISHKIIHDFCEAALLHDTKKIIKKLEVSYDQFNAAMMLIRTLNPQPGSQYTNEVNINIEPELTVKKIKNEWRVFLTDSILTNIKINKYYQELIKQNKKHGSYPALKQELEEAKWLLNGLKRRNETLLAVASYIVGAQKDFLDKGNEFMRPMNIADAAGALTLHESTISRVTTEKYIVTPRGIFELKYFFPSGVSTNAGGVCSAIAVKSIIKKLIGNEAVDSIKSDNDITEILRDKGINIARRTVAKYREAMKILPSYQRIKKVDPCREG